MASTHRYGELWVLDAAPTAALTLITCYPFDFAVPRRFVVHAEPSANPVDSSLISAAEEGRDDDRRA